MLTISKPLSAGQAQTYHAKEFTAPEQNYWKQGDEDHWLHGWGYYDETYVKRDGRWLIASRELTRTRVEHSEGSIRDPNNKPA